MLDSYRRFMAGVAAVKDRRAITDAHEPTVGRMASQCVRTGGDIVISSGGAATAKTGSADAYFVANGVLVKITASTTLPALVGTITAASFNVFCFFVDSAGTTSVLIGTEGTAIGLIKWPQFPKNKAYIGTLLVTHSSTFTGGTTPLDTATTVYLTSTSGGAFDPTVVLE